MTILENQNACEAEDRNEIKFKDLKKRTGVIVKDESGFKVYQYIAVEKKLKSNVNVNAVYYLDYDKDGRKEAFILTGKKGNSDEANTLWFGYCTNDKTHVKRIKKDVMLTAHTLKLKSAVLFCVGGYCETSTPETVYCVKGNKVKSIFDGDTINKLKGNSFTSIQSAYDSVRDSGGAWMGHTWKPYYFYI